MRTVGALYRSGVGIEPGRTVREAAQVMERTGVGSVAIVEGSRIVGIVTDRDLVRRVVATGLPSDARVDSVMSTPVISVDAEADIETAFDAFRMHGVRRLPVVRGGSFIGMLVVDDLLVRVAGQLGDLVRPITAEIMFAHRDAAVPAAKA
jgi:CBS domain-containing protein